MGGKVSWRRVARLALATVAALAVAAAALIFGLTQHALILNDAATAARLNPISSEALSEGAASAVAKGDDLRAEALARAAIETSPFNPIAFSSLAFVRERQQRDQDVAALMTAAARLSWADEAAQLWMIGRAVEGDKLEEAVLRTDALLRQRRIREALFSFLRGLMTEKRALRPIAERLATRPRWRQDFLTQLAQLSPAGYEAHEQLLVGLKKTAAPPTRGEVNAYIARLFNERRYAEGRTAWVRLAGRAGGDSLVSDPSFRRLAAPADASPFGWTLHSVPGTSLGPHASRGSDEPGGLHIGAEGRPSGRALEQALVLPPGVYRLIVEAHEMKEGSLPSLRWDISCLGGDGRAAISMPPSTGQAEAQRIEYAIQVPALACPAQRLELHIDHDAAPDLEAWIRQVDIQPAS